MDAVTLINRFGDSDPESDEALRSWGLRDTATARANLDRIRRAGVSSDLMVPLVVQLDQELRKVGDADMALNNFERFTLSSRSPLALAALIDRDHAALPTLLQIFSSSQHLSDVLIRAPESYDLLRLTQGQPVSRHMLVDDISSELDAIHDPRSAMAALRHFKQRETLRIAYGDLVGQQRLDLVTRQISYVAEAICHAAVSFARRQLEQRFGQPLGPDGRAAEYCILALGKLGGTELNYSSDIDLICFYDHSGTTVGPRSISHQEFFERLTRDVIRLLTEMTELGTVYRVDMRLRPHGKTGSLVHSLESMLRYYDLQGRTWERQAYVKARPIAGSLGLGRRFLEKLQPWIYHKCLSHSEITEIRALKRQIENRTSKAGGNERNVKEGRGGIRDIEFAIQFLQLLNGGELGSIRTENTLTAIAQLAESGCLTLQERGLLEESYVFLRRVEHRLQLLFDLQTHELPPTDEGLQKLARRLGYQGSGDESLVEQFRRDYLEKTEINRKILNFLLHDAFSQTSEIAPETDLILDPEPSASQVETVLGHYQFREVHRAYERLRVLSVESIPYLSHQRCRHFFASVLPKLLPLVGATPDPDATLISLENVSESIGGKGLLWELFSYHPPSMDLCVRLCAACPYLAEILTSHPGMIDELLDSLMVNRLPSYNSLRTELRELCYGAENVSPMLHAFKHAYHLCVGVRDILGKEDIVQTHATLSVIAEVLLQQIVEIEYHDLVHRYGSPGPLKSAENGDPDGANVCELVVLGMGKLGGSEPNYHSDLDLIFLYEEDGLTTHPDPKSATTHQHFFNQLAVRVLKRLNHTGPYGRLYETDARLRPTGQSGPLVVSIKGFTEYFQSGAGQLWERQSLCKARPIHGSSRAAKRVMTAVHSAMFVDPWQVSHALEVEAMRARMEATATLANLKRGIGGTVDIEFCVQMLQLRYGLEFPEVLQPGTLKAISSLEEAKLLTSEDAESLRSGYRLLRSVESRLRLLNTTARHDLPEKDGELDKLAYILRVDDVGSLQRELASSRRENQRVFQATVARLVAE